MTDIPTGRGWDLPDTVYLVTADGEWPVNAIAGGEHANRMVETMVEQRRQSGNIGPTGTVRVFKARLVDVRECDFLPTTTVQPQIRERT